MTPKTDERGSVTAEAAMVLPLVAAFSLVLVWMVSLGVAQVRAVDAARDAARALARGEDQPAAAAAARRTAPDGADVTFAESSDYVTVTVTIRAVAPDWLLLPMPSVTVASSSTVAVEGGAAHGD